MEYHIKWIKIYNINRFIQILQAVKNYYSSYDYFEKNILKKNIKNRFKGGLL